MWPDNIGLCCLPGYLQGEHGIVVANLNSALVQMSPQTWGFWQEHGGLPAADVTKVARSSSERVPVLACEHMHANGPKKLRKLVDFKRLTLINSRLSCLKVCKSVCLLTEEASAINICSSAVGPSAMAGSPAIAYRDNLSQHRNMLLTFEETSS